ncbi:MAG: HAD-IA family hydrolase [Sedimentisphaerales bacterium]|nr:HAD-IA family hydrolase [Sedimentisphaerales bacterium]
MKRIAAILFDLDGTLTVPCLDFAAMKEEMGIAEGYILEEMKRMSPAQRAHAEQVLDRHEEQAARTSQLNPGAAETLERLRREGRKIGLITRNCRASVKTISQIHGLVFDAVITREDGAAKPAPDPVLRACQLLDVAPDEAIMVGDYLHDMQAGKTAGTYTVLLSTHPNHRDYHGWADFVINRLEELHRIIEGMEDAADMKQT